MPWVASHCCRKIRSFGWSCVVGIVLGGSQRALAQNSPETDDLTSSRQKRGPAKNRRVVIAVVNIEQIRSEEQDSDVQLDQWKRMKAQAPWNDQQSPVP